MSEVCFHAVGRRKKAIARVRLIPGEGNIIINKRSIDDYFGYETLKTVVRQPLVLTETMAASTSSSTARAGGLPASRRHPPWHRPRAGEGQRGIQARHQEGRLSHPRSAHEGAQEVRSESRSSRAPVLQALNFVSFGSPQEHSCGFSFDRGWGRRPATGKETRPERMIRGAPER